ncbi:hypothetical protein PF008_g10400 [Phytophthora fragariae]|uniref:Pectate lyase n=1 Tax=Phytophthora fragariae TaxID=53985 RepID=A0A6G0RUD4_9STRA|nr:hypothetical protein PF008_g10400 [Phytophthora fragariae]
MKNKSRCLFGACAVAVCAAATTTVRSDGVFVSGINEIECVKFTGAVCIRCNSRPAKSSISHINRWG